MSGGRLIVRPIVTLTTDFGLRDPFVGIMKGVILGICPEAELVDLTHDIRPHDVLEGQLALEAAHRFFAPGTTHLAVVDPGVGTGRRGLAVMAGKHRYVGPDNGLFTFVFEMGDWSAVSLETGRYRLPGLSHTFHGRDIFAPAAAHLAAGVPVERLGPRVTDPCRSPIPRARRAGQALDGEVIGIDRFGNLLTSVTVEDLKDVGPPVRIEIGGHTIEGLVTAYAEGPPGQPAAILGSQDRLEIFVTRSSAATTLGVGSGAPVRVSR
jgi:S-adenosylmethionine hydrolase